MLNQQQLFRWIGPLAGIAGGLIMVYAGYSKNSGLAVCLLVWMGIWWMTEAFNLYFTSLLPLVYLPLTGLLSMEKVAPLYTKDIVFLFLGGFVMAHAIERWNLHRRLALRIILITGHRKGGILAGIMISAWLLSMFLNNTATVAVLLPAVLSMAVLAGGNTENRASEYLIGLSYAASIGGMGTVIGTAPNLILMDQYNEAYPSNPITFESWLMIGLPASLILLVACFFILRWTHRNHKMEAKADMQYTRNEYKKLGPLSYEEKWTTFFIFIAVILWIFIHDIKIGSIFIPGWSNLFPDNTMIKESTVAILICIILHFFPSRQKGTALATWEDFKKMPVGIIFLFGGGFALTEAVKVSGLDAIIGGGLAQTSQWPPWLFIGVLVSVIILLSEFASNTATLMLTLSILFPLLPSLGLQPIQVLFTATLAASCGFMLPVATPPNTLIYDTGKVPLKKLLRAGALMDAVAVVILTLLAFTLLSLF